MKTSVATLPEVPTMDSKADGVTAAEFREVSEGKLTSNRRTLPLAPFLQGAPLQRYVWYKQHYQQIRDHHAEVDDDVDVSLPPTFEDTRYCKRLIERYGSELATWAVREGHLATLNYLSGLTSRETDVSSLQAFVRVVERMRTDGYLGQFVGDTDGGKTMTALAMAELGLRDDDELVLATNVTSLVWQDDWLQERTEFVEAKSELRAVLDEHEKVVVVLDELSTVLDGQTNSYAANEQMYPLITGKAKDGARYILIGHRKDGKDIIKSVREHADDFIVQHRERRRGDDDVYSAEFFDRLDDDAGAVDLKFPLGHVPPITGTYEPDEKSTFDLEA